MERKNKACWNCGNYKAYYTKGFCQFDKLDYGVCRKQQETVDKHNQCEFWRNDYSMRTYWTKLFKSVKYYGKKKMKIKSIPKKNKRLT